MPIVSVLIGILIQNHGMVFSEEELVYLHIVELIDALRGGGVCDVGGLTDLGVHRMRTVGRQDVVLIHHLRVRLRMDVFTGAKSIG